MAIDSSKKMAVIGTIHKAATREAFLTLIAEANEHADTHDIVAVVPIQGKRAGEIEGFGVVYRRRQKGEPRGSFFDNE